MFCTSNPSRPGVHISAGADQFSHVHVLLYGVKFNGEIDIVKFIFTRCVAYSFSEYFFLLFHSTTILISLLFLRTKDAKKAP